MAAASSDWRLRAVSLRRLRRLESEDQGSAPDPGIYRVHAISKRRASIKESGRLQPPALRSGPRVGARVASQQRSTLRPGRRHCRGRVVTRNSLSLRPLAALVVGATRSARATRLRLARVVPLGRPRCRSTNARRRAVRPARDGALRQPRAAVSAKSLTPFVPAGSRPPEHTRWRPMSGPAWPTSRWSRLADP